MNEEKKPVSIESLLNELPATICIKTGKSVKIIRSIFILKKEGNKFTLSLLINEEENELSILQNFCGEKVLNLFVKMNAFLHDSKLLTAD
jgi:hypothetical protein